MDIVSRKYQGGDIIFMTFVRTWKCLLVLNEKKSSLHGVPHTMPKNAVSTYRLIPKVRHVLDYACA